MVSAPASRADRFPPDVDATIALQVGRSHYGREAIVGSGLVDERGRDRLWRTITFPMEETCNVYGRHIDAGASRHRFLAQAKGGLYGWRQARDYDRVIVVEGLFDLASL